MLARGTETGNEACQRLVMAACDEFARHGYAGARVRRIAEAAQVNLAAVNYYFGGKQGLYRATLRHLASQAHGSGKPHVDASEAERSRRRILATLDRFTSEHPSALGSILAHEAMAPTGNLKALLEETTLEPLRELLREIDRLAATPVVEK
jgi:AcrR family transcriptional regulator